MSEEIIETPDVSLNKKPSLYYIGLILNILTILLTTYSYIAFFAKILSVFIILVVGLVMLVLLILFTVISLGTIFLSSSGQGFLAAFKAVWCGEAINNITSILYLSLPYTLIIGIVVSALSITCFAFAKSKKGLISNIICLTLLILLLILRLCIGVV